MDVVIRATQEAKAELWVINEQFESIFNEVLASAVVAQRSQCKTSISTLITPERVLPIR
ncbi:MAG: hypothetical protein ACI85E_001829 [Marinomonas primoryensis]|jgi:hypothetical protein